MPDVKYRGGIAGSSTIVNGTYYRLTFASDSGWWDERQFPDRMRALLDKFYGPVRVVTQPDITNSSTTSVCDAVGVQPISLADLVAVVERLTGGLIHLVGIEKLASIKDVFASDAPVKREEQKTTAETDLADEGLLNRITSSTADFLRGVEKRALILVIVAVVILWLLTRDGTLKQVVKAAV